MVDTMTTVEKSLWKGKLAKGQRSCWLKTLLTVKLQTSMQSDVSRMWTSVEIHTLYKEGGGVITRETLIKKDF